MQVSGMYIKTANQGQAYDLFLFALYINQCQKLICWYWLPQSLTLGTHHNIRKSLLDTHVHVLHFLWLLIEALSVIKAIPSYVLQ